MRPVAIPTSNGSTINGPVVQQRLGQIHSYRLSGRHRISSCGTFPLPSHLVLSAVSEAKKQNDSSSDFCASGPYNQGPVCRRRGPVVPDPTHQPTSLHFHSSLSTFLSLFPDGNDIVPVTARLDLRYLLISYFRLSTTHFLLLVYNLQ